MWNLSSVLSRNRTFVLYINIHFNLFCFWVNEKLKKAIKNEVVIHARSEIYVTRQLTEHICVANLSKYWYRQSLHNLLRIVVVYSPHTYSQSIVRKEKLNREKKKFRLISRVRVVTHIYNLFYTWIRVVCNRTEAIKMIHVGDNTWNLRIFITDLQVEKTLRVRGDLHIGGVMLRLVDPG